MPTFTTPEPISVAIDMLVGDARITASARGDTVVTVRPSDPSHDQDVRAAEQTRVDYEAGRLVVRTPKQRGLGLFGKPGSVDVTIDLPTGSSVEAEAQIATFRCSGDLGDCRIKTSLGELQVDVCDRLDLNTSMGGVLVGHCRGQADVTGCGTIRIREIGAAAVVKNSNGEIWIGEVQGALRVSSANGDITIDRAHSSVRANTANGDVRVLDVARGLSSLKTACGEVELAIRAGTAARLDVRTSFGTVHRRLDAADQPAASEETLDVQARTSYGDILIRRA